MSDTPRTDAVARNEHIWNDRAYRDEGLPSLEIVEADFARELERELTDILTLGAHNGEESRLLIIHRLQREAAVLRKERDELRAEIGRITSKGTGVEGIDTET